MQINARKQPKFLSLQVPCDPGVDKPDRGGHRPSSVARKAADNQQISTCSQPLRGGSQHVSVGSAQRLDPKELFACASNAATSLGRSTDSQFKPVSSLKSNASDN